VNHISGTFVKLEQKAQFSTSTITLGGNLTRNDLRCQIAGTEAHSNMYGLYATNQRQHVDNFTQVEHLVANCTSDELYKGVLDDRSRAVFHGRIYVAQDAQQTDAYQNNRTLLLSPDAEIDTKPQLEIYADDVKCSHGATIGQLKEEYLFYLRARGVDNSKARRMLTFAFVKQALGAISMEPLKIYLEEQLDQQLLKGGHYGD
jgi:Fe-S cluster assembly protein SufD